MAMADLAKFGEGAAIPLSAIADRQGLSLSYLEQIFLRLRRAGLVESERGRTGGYVLGRPACMIRIAEIMEAVHEETRMTRCFDGDVGCLGVEERCLVHGLWHALGGHIATMVLAAAVAHGVAAVMKRRPVAERTYVPHIVGTLVVLALVFAGIMAIGRPIVG